jgi:hypothetical protein
MALSIGQRVWFAGADSVVLDVGERGGRPAYLIENGASRIPMWVPEEIIITHQAPGQTGTMFNTKVPELLVVDDFFCDPDEVRAVALAQEYSSDLRFYKGLRSNQRFLWPNLREEFGRLLGSPVTEWLGHSANGVFQQTAADDPLVWHHDSQAYAAAVYLNPDAPLQGGTSFWRDRTYGCRRSPSHPSERKRLGSEEAVKAAEATVYDEFNLVNPDNWELVESVAGLYNRLVIWDARLIHSATSYTAFGHRSSTETRLVQLFFFDA